MNVPAALYNWNFYRVLVWIIMLAFEAAMEFLGVFDLTWPTLTGLTRKHLPLWLIWMILGWLVGHFGLETALVKYNLIPPRK